MKKNNPKDYLDKTRSQMMAEIGNQSNTYLSDIWYCHVKTSWLGRKTEWIIYFENDNVHKIQIKKR